jgi:mono/diheme cytochrome c family protein
MSTGTPLAIGIVVSILGEMLLPTKIATRPNINWGWIPTQPRQEAFKGTSARRERPTPAGYKENSRPAVSNSAAMRLFERKCSNCHGTDGRGMEDGIDLSLIPNFTSAAWQAKRSDRALRISIAEGKGTRMPSFRHRLSEKEIDGLITVVRAFGPQSTQGKSRQETSGAAGSDDFSIRFLELQKEMEELNRQLKALQQKQPRP